VTSLKDCGLRVKKLGGWDAGKMINNNDECKELRAEQKS
jgi:hypothetical protein